MINNELYVIIDLSNEREVNMYSKEDIQKWFEIMREKYKGSQIEKHLKGIEMMMFDAFWDSDNIDCVLKKER